MRIALVAKRGSAQAVQLARELAGRFGAHQWQADLELAQALGWRAPATRDAVTEGVGLVVVLGGDGTLIYGARMLRGHDVPILGINLGSLGFLTEVAVAELYPVLEEALAGKAVVESRMKLHCRLERQGKVLLEDEVLNDVVVNKGALARIADHECHIDGHYVTTYKSDGVVIATPTGSTAYALSAGGPILHPTVDCAVIAPICPHALTQRPLVVPGTSIIQLSLKTEVSDVFLTLDGQTGHGLETGDRLVVQRSANRVSLIRNRKVSYFGILRQKLHWGER
jgi:NAD+ kinase